KHVAYDGLNLTYQTLDGVLKYKTCIDAAALAVSDDPVKGFYAWDRELVAAIVHYTGSGYARSFECQIMDVADDIAYSVHDLEDSLKAGLISLSDFHRAPPPRVVQAEHAEPNPHAHAVHERAVHRGLVCMAKRLRQQ